MGLIFIFKFKYAYFKDEVILMLVATLCLLELGLMIEETLGVGISYIV